MMRLEAVSRQRHAGKFWRKADSFYFSAATSAVPLIASEISVAAMNVPVAFVRNQSRFTLVGLLSLIPGKNHLVGPDGRWLVDHVPLEFRGYPFRLAWPAGSGIGSEMVLCVDENAVMGEAGEDGKPFLDDNGGLAEPVRQVFDFLKQLEESRAITDHAVSALADAGVITEWSLTRRSGDEEVPINGIHRIDEERLSSLSEDGFLKLRKANALFLAYSQILSMDNIRELKAFAEMFEQKDQTPTQDLGDFTLVDDRLKY